MSRVSKDRQAGDRDMIVIVVAGEAPEVIINMESSSSGLLTHSISCEHQWLDDKRPVL